MKQLLSAAALFLTPFQAWAAGEMNEVASAPVELVDVTFVVVFFILFIGMIAWFFVHMWRTEKKRQQGQ